MITDGPELINIRSEEALLSYRRKDLISYQVEPGWQLHTMLFRRSYILTFHRIHTINTAPETSLEGCSCCLLLSIRRFFFTAVVLLWGWYPLVTLSSGTEGWSYSEDLNFLPVQNLSGQPRILTEGGFEPGTWRFGPQTSLALDH